MFKQKVKRINYLSHAALIVVALVAPVFLLVASPVSALQIPNPRSITLEFATNPTDVNSDSIDDGASAPGANANHHFLFSNPTGGNIGSIQFLYCTTPAGACTMPPGLDTTNISALTQDNNVNGFTLNDTTNGAPFITRASAGASTEALEFILHDVENPTINWPTERAVTFFVRISTHTGITPTGPNTDDTGSVAAAIVQPVILNGTMPESLVFCTGETVGLTAGVPDCTTATLADDVDFNDYFTPLVTRFATSQMAASTNAEDGYAITLSGPTMTSGTNTIDDIGATAEAPILAKVGGQFGMNLRENLTLDTNPVGDDIAAASNGTNLRGQPTAQYNIVDQFAFNAAAAQTVAISNNGSLGGTDSQIYTATYIVNVPGSQPAGGYTTTLTYICTATF